MHVGQALAMGGMMLFWGGLAAAGQDAHAHPPEQVSAIAQADARTGGKMR